MTTPLILLALLVGPAAVAGALGEPPERRRAAATAGLVLVFLFTGVGHFLASAAMAHMLPSFVPARVLLVRLSGVAEIALALALLAPGLRRPVGWLIIAMLVAFLPLNIYAAVNRVSMGGHAWGPMYLLIRVPLQALLVWWTWCFAVREGDR